MRSSKQAGRSAFLGTTLPEAIWKALTLTCMAWWNPLFALELRNLQEPTTLRTRDIYTVCGDIMDWAKRPTITRLICCVNCRKIDPLGRGGQGSGGLAGQTMEAL